MSNLQQLDILIGCARFWLHKAEIEHNAERHSFWLARLESWTSDREALLALGGR